MDAADPLLDHCGIPRELEIDARARCVLKIEPDPACVGQEHHAGLRIVVKFYDALSPLPWRLGTREEHRALAGVTEHVFQAPGREPQHAPPLAKHDDLPPLLEHEIADDSTELNELRHEKPLE